MTEADQFEALGWLVARTTPAGPSPSVTADPANKRAAFDARLAAYRGG